MTVKRLVAGPGSTVLSDGKRQLRRRAVGLPLLGR